MTTKSIWDTVLHPLTHPTPIEDPLRLLSKILTKLYSIWVSLTYPFGGKGHKLSIHWTCDLRRSRAHRIKLGNSVEIRKDAIVDVVALPEWDGEPIIVVDDDALIGCHCLISATNVIHIERDVIMAQSVLIMDHGYVDEDTMLPIHKQGFTEGGRIRIGEGSWIGQGAAIVCTGGELVLGRNCVVGANAVVTQSFPPHSVIFGNPAKVIRHFDPVRNAWVLGGTQTAETVLSK